MKVIQSVAICYICDTNTETQENQVLQKYKIGKHNSLINNVFKRKEDHD